MSEAPFDPLLALRVLVDHGVRFIVIGGYGAAIRGSPMITGDLDVCYSKEGPNLESMAAALRDLGATLRGAPPGLPFRLDARTLQLGDHFTLNTIAGRLDVMATLSGAEGFDQLDRSAADVDLDGLTVRVASIDDLMRMKRAAGRPKDLIGLEWLAALRDEIRKRDD